MHTMVLTVHPTHLLRAAIAQYVVKDVIGISVHVCGRRHLCRSNEIAKINCAKFSCLLCVSESSIGALNTASVMLRESS